MHDTNLLKNLYGLLNEGKLDRGKFFALLSRTLVQEIGCTRASFWFYAGPLQDQAVCESLYDAGDQQWSSGMVLHEDDFGDYFAAMREGRVLVASDRPPPVSMKAISSRSISTRCLMSASTSTACRLVWFAAKTPPRSRNGVSPTCNICSRRLPWLAWP
jgi:hypothetical protein